MSLRVHLMRETHEPSLAYLREELLPTMSLSVGDGLPEPSDYGILVAGPPRREHLTASSSLRALIVPFAGLTPRPRALMRDVPHISAHNLHYNAGAFAEIAVALRLAAAKLIVPCDRALRLDDWWPRHGSSPSLLLEGKTVPISATARLGSGLLACAMGWGCK